MNGFRLRVTGFRLRVNGFLLRVRRLFPRVQSSRTDLPTYVPTYLPTYLRTHLRRLKVNGFRSKRMAFGHEANPCGGADPCPPPRPPPRKPKPAREPKPRALARPKPPPEPKPPPGPKPGLSRSRRVGRPTARPRMVALALSMTKCALHPPCNLRGRRIPKQSWVPSIILCQNK